jgi:hypothetical protein
VSQRKKEREQSTELESVEFSSYQGCHGFRIELRAGVEESSGNRLSGSGDSAVRVSCRESRETQL